MKEFNLHKKSLIYTFSVILLCFSFIILMINTTIAWFKDDSTTSNGEPNIILVGTLALDVTTDFNFYNLALAPDRIYKTDHYGNDIGTYVKTAYNHDIEGAYVRIKFNTTRKNVGESTYIDNTDLLQLYFEPNVLTTAENYSSSAKDKWYYNSSDGYYYYIGAVEDSSVQFNSGYRTTNLMNNIVRNAEVKIYFTVESIQRQYDAYVSVWTSAPTIFTDWAVEDKEGRWGQA